MNYWEVARLAKMPGSEVLIKFYPDKVSKRIMNSARKILTTGINNKGWRSDAGRIATMLAKKFDILLVRDRSHWRYVNIDNIPPEAIPGLKELLTADLVARKFYFSQESWVTHNPGWLESHINMIRNRFDTQLGELRLETDLQIEGHALTIVNHINKFKPITQEERVKQAFAALDAGKPMTLVATKA